jgi:NADH:ubiquinone oxidoreductase subunit 6 (subunit J)
MELLSTLINLLSYIAAVLLLVVSVVLYMTRKEDENAKLTKGSSIAGMVVGSLLIALYSFSLFKSFTGSSNLQNGAQNTSTA